MSIGKKIFSTLGILILAIVVVQGSVTVFMVQDDLQESAINSLTNRTKSVVDMLSDTVSITEADLNIVRSHQAIQDLLTYLVFEDEDSMSTEVDKLEFFLKRVINAKTHYEIVQLVGHERTLMQLNTGERTQLFSKYDNKAAYKLLKQNSETSIGHTIQIIEDKVFLISVAALSVDNQTEGMLRLVQPLNNKIANQLNNLASQGLHGVISNDSGKLIAHSQKLLPKQAHKMSQNQLTGWASTNLEFPILKWQVTLGMKESEAFAVVDELVMAAIAVGVTVLLAATVVLGALIFRIVTRPINNITTKMNDIAKGEGDLTARLDTNRQDEVGKLAAAFNEFVGKMQSTMLDVLECSKQLGSEATELDTNAKLSYKNVEKQQAKTVQVATATTELSATAHEVARITASASEAARIASDETDNGKLIAKSAKEAINKLATEVEKTATVVGSLADDSQNINSILGVINDVAEQTNLLALNAAIEAARAGEHGRGFAVVADEVRQLASSTHESTKKIHEIIERLQSGANNAVQVMDNSRRSANEGVEQVARVTNSLALISDSIVRLNDENLQIANAAEEQGSVTESVNRDIESISQMAEDAAQGAKATTDAAHTLSKMANHMEATLGQFKV